MMLVILREVRDGDIERFFEHQLDQTAQKMAAFTAPDPSDKEGIMKHFEDNLNNELIDMKTIECEGVVVGHIVSYIIDDQRHIGYWIDRAHWGKGIASQALLMYLPMIKDGAVYARAAKHNIASRRVLEKCGFTLIKEDLSFANAYAKDIDECWYRLD